MLQVLLEKRKNDPEAFLYSAGANTTTLDRSDECRSKRIHTNCFFLVSLLKTDPSIPANDTTVNGAT